MTYLFIFALGVFFGAFLVYKFNPKDITVNGKNKAKNGGVIDFKALIEKPKKEKKKLFNFKNRRKRNGHNY